MTLIHGTGIFYEGRGILFTGPSGSGKSDLALRVMARGAELVGDDYLELSLDENERLIMSPVANIAGRIEVRNVGIMPVPHRAVAPVDLVLDLKDRAQLERLPDPKFSVLEGANIPCLDFFAFDLSAPEKLRAALNILCQ
ncbi:HPr kinase/phosphorylase [hydrothermal vent metagenome]|uniref:HPr kinase/phosphorylase n=1 Tax=hydrothermal vent metagenome TaxID=652676 RepID=A0A3B0R441_9ZZZZ